MNPPRCAVSIVYCCIEAVAWVTGKLPELEMGLLMYLILGAAVGLKIVLYLYCVALKGRSDSMLALAEVGSASADWASCTAFHYKSRLDRPQALHPKLRCGTADQLQDDH